MKNTAKCLPRFRSGLYKGGGEVYKYRGDGKVESRRKERKGRGWIFFFFLPLYFPPLSFLFLNYTFFMAKLFFAPMPRNDPSKFFSNNFQDQRRDTSTIRSTISFRAICKRRIRDVAH